MFKPSPSRTKKIIEIVAGPNGSGKTTFANVYLLGKKKRLVYLNPDRIATGIGPIDFERASFQAGRVLINQIKTMIERGESFAFESTLSGRTWVRILERAVESGYEITIYFLFLNSVENNLQRIKKRVRLGGHSIPAEAVQRRHPRCFDNFWMLYRPLSVDWYVLNNSRNKPKLIQSKASFEAMTTTEKQSFANAIVRGKTS